MLTIDHTLSAFQLFTGKTKKYHFGGHLNVSTSVQITGADTQMENVVFRQQ
jgi:hypothetical protein